jgi:hypothetical protein
MLAAHARALVETALGEYAAEQVGGEEARARVLGPERACIPPSPVARMGGTRIIADMRNTLTHFPFRRTGMQERYVDAAIQALLYPAYGDSMTTHQIAIARYHGIATTPRRLVAALTPRQQGKSTILGQILAATLLAFRAGSIVVIANAKDIGLQLQRLVVKNMESVPGAMDRVLTNRIGFLEVRGADGGRVSIDFRASGGSSQRGHQASIALFVDESAFLKSTAWTDYISPMIPNSRLAVIMVTTPATGIQSRWANFLTMTEYGSEIPGSAVNLVEVRVACDACIETVTFPCAHLIGNLPPWRSDPRGMHYARGILRGDEDTINRELLGINIPLHPPAFPPELVAQLKLAPPRDPGFIPPLIFVAVDPSAGGTSQDALLAAAFSCDGTRIYLTVCRAKHARSTREARVRAREASKAHEARVRVREASSAREARAKRPAHRVSKEREVSVCARSALRVFKER